MAAAFEDGSAAVWSAFCSSCLNLLGAGMEFFFALEEAKKQRKYLLGISRALETKTSYNENIWLPVVENLFQHFESTSMLHIDI